MLQTWKRKGYTVEEIEFDFDLHHFQVIKEGETIATICPQTIENMNEIKYDLNNGEDVDDWEDGFGNTISI
nr:hypothetical protein [Bacillaceae bacterium JMAK1]